MSDENNKADKYKDTVFLPKTDFPMRGGLAQKEPEILSQWSEMDLYARLRENAKDKPKWVLHDGPPYANGHLHMGHALNKVLKDVVVKSYSMLGYNAPYVPGWDCHGLPIEWKIEEKYRKSGKDKDDVDIIDFRAECRNFAKGWVDIQSEEFQRLGVSGDWKNPYLTMNYRAESQIANEIHKFAKNGGLYRGVKPIMWSVVEKTALAEAEIEYKEHKSVTIWIQFPVKQTSCELLNDAQIIIWTTTPWTMPSNRAIAYSDNVEYGVYEITKIGEDSTARVGGKLAMAVSLADAVKSQAKIEEWTLLGTIKGAEIAGTIAQHPLNGFDGADGHYDFDVPLLLGDFVTEEAGTGFVHIAAGHGEDDYHLVCAANMERADDNQIEITDNVTDDGVYRDHVALFAGMEVYTQEGKLGGGNFAVLKCINEAGKLLSKGSMRHEYPHSWRSKAPLIFRTTPQWFISMKANDLRASALKAIKETKWVPEKGQTRITAMIEGRPDWCISRQRSWGVPIALFVHKETRETLLDDEVFARIISTFEEEGADAWWVRDAAYFLGDSYNVADYDQIFDIVDVWFESGSTHAFVADDREDLLQGTGQKCDLYLEGSDQHRGWFHSSLLESCGTKGHAPYKAVLTHGFVLDKDGYKMSKSDGNTVDPAKIINQSGADILRYWTMMCDYAEDMRISPQSIKSASDLYRRIRNTLRFLLGALEGFNEEERVDLSDARVPELERLMLHELSEMDDFIREAIKNYEFGKVAKRLHDFCNSELSAFYFDIRKDRLYCDAPDMFERRVTRTVMAEIFDCLVAWLAPILAFTAEEAWSHRTIGVFDDADSVHLREFPKVPESWKDEELAAKWREIKKIRKNVQEAIEPLRASKELGSSLEAALVITTANDVVSILKSVNLADICITSSASIEEGEERVAISKAYGSKCVRCWKILPEVSEETGVCNRCEAAAKGFEASEKAA